MTYLPPQLDQGRPANGKEPWRSLRTLPFGSCTFGNWNPIRLIEILEKTLKGKGWRFYLTCEIRRWKLETRSMTKFSLSLWNLNVEPIPTGTVFVFSWWWLWDVGLAEVSWSFVQMLHLLLNWTHHVLLLPSDTVLTCIHNLTLLYEGNEESMPGVIGRLRCLVSQLPKVKICDEPLLL